jgi:hypothetical protein
VIFGPPTNFVDTYSVHFTGNPRDFDTGNLEGLARLEGPSVTHSKWPVLVLFRLLVPEMYAWIRAMHTPAIPIGYGLPTT